jgi:hypothetical protein
MPEPENASDRTFAAQLVRLLHGRGWSKALLLEVCGKAAQAVGRRAATLKAAERHWTLVWPRFQRPDWGR